MGKNPRWIGRGSPQRAVLQLWTDPARPELTQDNGAADAGTERIRARRCDLRPVGLRAQMKTMLYMAFRSLI